MKQHITKTVHSITFLFIFFFFTNVNAQNIAIEQDGACINCPNATTSDPSAALEVRAIDRGILIPRVISTVVIPNPAEGLMIYDNSVDAFKYYDGSSWQDFGNVEHISFTSIDNTFVGANAGKFNTIGVYNTANGAYALRSNTIGEGNTANGRSTLYSNTTGNGNTANGRHALYDNTTGNNNTANGVYALNRNITGVYNTANGASALNRNTTGNDNTAIGRSALYFNATGNDNTAIGNHASVLSANYNNSTAIGAFAEPNGSNRVRLGDNSITQIGGAVGWSNVSDARFKTQIQSNVPGLAFISLLNPVTYQMDMDAIAKHHRTPDSLRLAESERAKAAIRYTGFLAQEVEKAAESVGYDFSGVDAPQHERDNYSLRYAEFVVPLVKAVQELEAENKTLRAQHADLEARLGKIEALLRQRAE